MKLNIIKPKAAAAPAKKAGSLSSRLPAKAPSSGGSKKSKPAWMTTGEDEIEEGVVANEALNGNRPPELWVPDGETKVVRFRDDAPYCSIFQYNIKLGAKKFKQATQPPSDEPDLFSAAGKQASLKVIYEVLDVKGYKSEKDGKKHVNVPRFYSVGSRLHKQLKAIADRRGGLTGFDIEISRTGTGQKTTYTLIPGDKEPMTKEQSRIPRLTDDFEKYYAPLDEAAQKQLLSRAIDDDDF